MRTRFSTATLAAKSALATNAVLAAALVCMTSLASAQQPVTIRAGTVLDGKGGVRRNAVVAVEGSRIVKVGDGTAEGATYDLSRFTVLPGMIDTHVHIGAHFGKDGRASTPGETPAEEAFSAPYNASSAGVSPGVDARPSLPKCAPM